MKATPKAIGKMPCMCCGEYITVKQADTGTVSVSCPDCDFSGYGKAGTDAHKIIMGKVTLKRPDTPAAIAAPAAPAPAARKPTAPASKTAPAAPAAPVPAARKPTAPASKTAPAAPAAPVRNTLFG